MPIIPPRIGPIAVTLPIGLLGRWLDPSGGPKERAVAAELAAPEPAGEPGDALERWEEEGGGTKSV